MNNQTESLKVFITTTFIVGIEEKDRDFNCRRYETDLGNDYTFIDRPIGIRNFIRINPIVSR